jgi:hypothetical protein
MLAHSQPADNTKCFGRQWASSCSGKHGFLGLSPSIVCCRHVDLHYIGTVMGFHAVTPWQNETFHFLYYMNIITLITHTSTQHEQERRKQTTLIREHRGALLPCESNVVCFCLSSPFWRFGANDDVMWSRRTLRPHLR